jgi:hypothetical protein
MRLAAALSHRADLTTRADALAQRAYRSALAQEGMAPVDDPAALVAEHDAVLGELETLVVRINLTNAATDVDGVPLTAALARRDTLRRRHRTLTSLAEQSTPRADRMLRSELRLLPTSDVASLHAAADQTAKALRELDLRIQEVNWATELR